MNNSWLVSFYVKLVLEDRKNIEDVPEILREEVRKILEEEK